MPQLHVVLLIVCTVLLLGAQISEARLDYKSVVSGRGGKDGAFLSKGNFLSNDIEVDMRGFHLVMKYLWPWKNEDSSKSAESAGNLVKDQSIETLREHQLLRSYALRGSTDEPNLNCSGRGIRLCDGDDNCTANASAPYTCICPLDYHGQDCETRRSYNCTYILLSPTPECENVTTKNKQNLLDSDPRCLVYSIKDTVTFEYQFLCKFTNTSGISATKPYDNQFTYWSRRGDEFAISEQPESLRAIFKPFNFDSLSDIGAAIIIDSDPLQAAGLSPFRFTITFSDIHERYLAGNRLYVETGWSRDSDTDGLENRAYKDRRFIDFTDYQRQWSVDNSLTGGQIAGIVIGVLGGVGLAILIAVMVWRYKKRKAAAAAEEAEARRRFYAQALVENKPHES